MFCLYSLFKAIGKLFTKREREVMKLCVPGNTNADIAKILSITVPVVKFHKGNIFKKSEVIEKMIFLARRLITGYFFRGFWIIK